MTWDTLRFCGSWLTVVLLRLQFRLCVSGEIPQGDRVAIVANHQSHLDTITLLAALPAKRRHQVVVLAAADYLRLYQCLPTSMKAQFKTSPICDRTSLLWLVYSTSGIFESISIRLRLCIVRGAGNSI